jgi:two-component system chemotaxis sensor kinase CheA
MRAMVEDTRAAVERNLTFAMPARADEVLMRLRAHTGGMRVPAPTLPTPAAPHVAAPMPMSMPIAVPAPAETAVPAATPAWLAQVVEAPRAVAVTGANAAASARIAVAAPEARVPGPSPAETPAGARIRETVKVDLERVDLLVELIGELVIAESMVAGRSESSAAPELRNALRHLTKIVRDLQRMGIGLRMVPLVGVFQKMRRLVRDLCVKVGKEAVLVTQGDGIEMDRSLVEQVADPLVHILRNAMDHGLETPQDRVAAGKPAQGTIVLSASHEAGNIVIEVRDDGRGMDRARIVARAVERGLIEPDADLADAEVFELIFAPGFSTAERVTEVSGRGVGMDVVKRNVEAMGGRVRVSSVTGAGSTVRLTVPLTLAIIDGMLIGCGGERFVVPTRSIVESIRAESRMLVTYAGRHEVVDIRGELYPLVRLHPVLDIPARSVRIEDGLILVVEGITRRFAILVDEVVSRQQVVIKAMDDRLVDTRFYSGACILADGHAGLILNIDALLAQSDGREATGGAA